MKCTMAFGDVSVGGRWMVRMGGLGCQGVMEEMEVDCLRVETGFSWRGHP